MNHCFTAMVPYRTTPAVQARLDAQRQSIVAAAIAVLSDVGYSGCSVAAVAARAGVATGTVYKHFASKTDLVGEVFDQVVEGEVAAVAAASTVPDHPADRIVAVLRTYAFRALRVPRLAYVLLAEPVDNHVEAKRLEFRRAYQDIVAEVVADGVATGELPQQNPKVTAAALVGAYANVMVGPLSSTDPSSNTVPELVEFTLRALGGRHEPDT